MMNGIMSCSIDGDDDETRLLYERMSIIDENNESITIDNKSSLLSTMSLDRIGKVYAHINHMHSEELRVELRRLRLDSR